VSGDKALSRAKWLALRYLATRARSRAEAAAYLGKKEVPEEHIEHTLSYLEEYGYIDDRKFAATYSRYLIEKKGLSRRALAFELKKKGVSEEDASPALEELFGDGGEDEYEVALRMARKKAATLKGVEREKARRRLAGFLQRRGYSFEVVRKTLRELGKP